MYVRGFFQMLLDKIVGFCPDIEAQDVFEKGKPQKEHFSADLSRD